MATPFSTLPHVNILAVEIVRRMSNQRKNMHLQKVEADTKPRNSADRNGRQEFNKLKLSGLTLTETLHAPSSTMPAHVHDAASICLTLTGQGTEIIDGSRVITEPGCVLMRGPQMIHADQYGAVPHRGFMIELEQRWLDTCRHFLRVFEHHRHFQGGPVPALALRIYRESRVKDSLAAIIVEGLMLEMLGHAPHGSNAQISFGRRQLRPRQPRRKSVDSIARAGTLDCRREWRLADPGRRLQRHTK